MGYLSYTDASETARLDASTRITYEIRGILVLVIGLLFCLFSLNMNVSVEIDSQSYGYGITTASMRVANADLMAQRQNYLIFQEFFR